MTDHLHRSGAGDSCPLQVPHGRPPKIVRNAIGQSSFLAGAVPGSPVALDRFPIAVEQPRCHLACRPLHLSRSSELLFEHGAKFWRERKLPPLPGLRTALEFVERGSIAHLLLTDANEYILRRRGDSDAAGLVVCVDCRHADRVADLMRTDVIPSRPVVACSRLFDPGDPEPANAIRGFRASHEPWLIAVEHGVRRDRYPSVTCRRLLDESINSPQLSTNCWPRSSDRPSQRGRPWASVPAR